MAALKYLGAAAQSVWTVLVPGWLQAFQISRWPAWKPTVIFTAGLFLLALVLLGLGSLPGAELYGEESNELNWPAQFLLIGVALLVLGSIPFWITGLPILLGFPSNRFIIPSIPGAAFILTALLGFLIRLPGKWRHLPEILLVVLVVHSSAGSSRLPTGFAGIGTSRPAFCNN